MCLVLLILTFWLGAPSWVAWVAGILTGMTILSFLSERAIYRKVEGKGESHHQTKKTGKRPTENPPKRFFPPANVDGLCIATAHPNPDETKEFEVILPAGASAKTHQIALEILNRPDDFVALLLAQTKTKPDIANLEMELFGESGLQIESVEFSDKTRPSCAELHLADPMGVLEVLLLFENGEFFVP
jgi:hypothetical protein